MPLPALPRCDFRMHRIIILVVIGCLAVQSPIPAQALLQNGAPSSSTSFGQYGGFAQSSHTTSGPAQLSSANNLSAGTTFYGYEIGPLDVLEIVVYNAPEFSIVQRVRPDGTIRVPLLKNLVAVAGLTPLTAESRIAGALVDEEMMVEPIVMVGVREYHSNPVLVTGAVLAPTFFQAVGPTTLLEAISRAQGFTESTGEWIQIERFNANGEPESSIRVSTEDFRHGLNGAQETPVHGGEKVRVDEARTAFVIGAGRPSGPVVVDGEDGSELLDFISRAGITPTSDNKKLIIFRKSQSKDTERDRVELDLRKIERLEVSGISVMPDDIVYFPSPKNPAGTGLLRRVAETGLTQSILQMSWLLWR